MVLVKLRIWRKYFGQIYGFGEIILAKLRIWRSDFGEIEGFGESILAKFMDLVKLFWPN